MHSALAEIYRLLEETDIRKILTCELCVRPALTVHRLNGSLMVIINPPRHIDKTLRELQPWLAGVLAEDNQGSERVEWLVEEESFTGAASRELVANSNTCASTTY